MLDFQLITFLTLISQQKIMVKYEETEYKTIVPFDIA